MNYLDMFIEDCRYYDTQQKEVKAILKHVDLNGKNVLDVGAGIGRLAFPLSRYAREVIAVDADKRLAPYWRRHRRKNVRFINQKFEQYVKKGQKKFDVILLAWPTFDFSFIPLVKKAMYHKSSFIFITCEDTSDAESVIDHFFPQGYFPKFVKKKQRFLKELEREFRIVKKKKIRTLYVYPNKATAFRVLKNDFELWYPLKFNKKTEQKLRGIIYQHRKGKKIIFGEEIWFCLLKKEGGKHAR